MGGCLLATRLALRDLRHHPAQALLLVLVIAASTTVLTLGLALNGVTSHPYQQTQAATKGPDVVAYLPVINQPGKHSQPPTQATALIHARGVTAASGPYPIAAAVIRAHGLTAGVEAEGRSDAQAAVDQPKVTAGTWVRPGGVVIERTFAEALNVGIGSRVTLNGRPFRVAGIAVTAAQAPYPNLCYVGAGGCFVSFSGIGPTDIGLVWMTERDVAELTPAGTPVAAYIVNLRLRNPAAAEAFAQSHGADGNTPVTWEGIASADGLLVKDEQSVLAPGSLLLSLLALALVAVLVGGRLAEQRRRVGLLKAVGGTPSLVAATFLVENLALALAAAAAGLAAGRLAAPLLTSPGAALVGVPGAPAMTLAGVIEVAGVALVIALASTLVPAIRAARSTTVGALADAARPPRCRSRWIRISSRLPLPMLFGLRLVARRPRRALLSAGSVAVTVTGIVAVLAFHAKVAAVLGASGASAGKLADPVVSRDEQMLTVITVMLVALAALTAIFTAWATMLDSRRATALLRALGARAPQVSGGLAAAQVLSALPGALLGVLLGIGLFKVASGVAPSRPHHCWSRPCSEPCWPLQGSPPCLPGWPPIAP
jgi:putative ABC transport system permease protein